MDKLESSLGIESRAERRIIIVVYPKPTSAGWSPADRPEPETQRDKRSRRRATVVEGRKEKNRGATLASARLAGDYADARRLLPGAGAARYAPSPVHLRAAREGEKRGSRSLASSYDGGE